MQAGLVPKYDNLADMAANPERSADILVDQPSPPCPKSVFRPALDAAVRFRDLGCSIQGDYARIGGERCLTADAAASTFLHEAGLPVSCPNTSARRRMPTSIWSGRALEKFRRRVLRPSPPTWNSSPGTKAIPRRGRGAGVGWRQYRLAR